MKVFFLSWLLCEKVLLVVFVVGVVVMWLLGVGKCVGKFWSEVCDMMIELKLQDVVFGQKDLIVECLYVVIEQFDFLWIYDLVWL